MGWLTIPPPRMPITIATSSLLLTVLLLCVLLHVTENEFCNQFLNIYRRFSLAKLLARLERRSRFPRGNLDVPFADQPFGFDRDPSVYRQFDAVTDLQDHFGMIIFQIHCFHPADLHSGQFDHSSRLQPPGGGEVRLGRVAPGPGGIDMTESDRDIHQNSYSEKKNTSHY